MDSTRGQGPGKRGRTRPWTLAWRAAREFGRHDGSQHAAAIAYYALLSFAPFVLLLASFASLLVGGSPEDVRASLDVLRPLLPAADEKLWARFNQFVAARGVFSLASVLLLSWLASRVTASTKTAILAVFGVAPTASPAAGVRARLQSWLVTLGILMALALAFVSVGIFEFVVATAPGDVVGAGLLRSALLRRDLVPFIMTAAIAMAVYVALPPRRVSRWNAALGALVAAGLHAVATRLFTLFVALATERDIIYGSFVGIVSFTAWFYIAAALLLFGAEIVALLEAERGGRSA